MAELGLYRPSACCGTAEQDDCCDPTERDACCTSETESCGCSAGAVAAADVRKPVPSCDLDAAGLRDQLERYRRIGEGARTIERSARRVAVEVSAEDARDVESAIAVERECCPFFVIAWEPDGRRLTVSVAEADYAPALDAIASALGA